MKLPKQLILIGAISTGFVLSANNAVAAVVYDNGAPLVYASKSDLASSGTLGAVLGAVLGADNFTLSGSETIANIFWSGLYFGANTLTEPDDFTIIFYSDSLGLPDNSGVLGTYTPGNTVNRVDSGGGADIYNYSVDISPLMLSAGTYWVSIFNNTSADTDDAWSWSLSSAVVTGGGDAVSRLGINAAWTDLNSEFSFVLNDTAAVVPVPAAAWLMGSGLLAVFGFSRRRSTAV